MKKLVLLLIFPIMVHSHEIHKYNQQVLKNFYAKLFEEYKLIKNDTSFFTARDKIIIVKIKGFPYNYSEQIFDYVYLFPDSNFKVLTHNLSLEKINESIDNALTYNVGELFNTITILELSANYKLFIETPYDTPYFIHNMFHGNGNEIMCENPTKLSPTLFLLWPGHINIETKEINIYSSTSNKSKIIGTIKSDELFFYVPHNTSNWVKVSKKNDGRYLKGYIQKNKIAPLHKMPKHLFKKLEKIRDHC